MGAQAIQCGDVYLRPLRITDLAQIMKAIAQSADELKPFAKWFDCVSEEAEAEFIRLSQRQRRMRTDFVYGVFRGTDGLYLGGIGLHDVSFKHRRAELGYWVRTGFHRRGIATAASARMLLYAVDDLDLNVVFVRTAVANKSSQAVIRKLGFREIGRARKDLVLRGRALDHFYYDILATEIKRRTKRLERLYRLKLD